MSTYTFHGFRFGERDSAITNIGWKVWFGVGALVWSEFSSDLEGSPAPNKFLGTL